jgi:DNA-binding transcriptional MerR regulator
MIDEASWTLDELVQRVAVCLADPAYPGAPNGRVRDLPDRRAVRWYTTTGLVDRPAMQGRTALYSPRHLLQVVAVKRRQADGLSLAEVQAELTGATDDTLREVAAIPDSVVAEPMRPELAPPPARPSRRSRFWAEPPAAAPPVAARNSEADDTVTKLAAVSLPGGAVLLLPDSPDANGRPDQDDVDAIHAAARPLLELLSQRGLLSGPPPLDDRSPS